ncbi:hypothetical protein RR48_02768 [Papilio machaon]|uniref:Uncharacterized protein n=1 Tax=Papilio machaon TaxID=76193 RepID=A0A0N1IBI7_PAPMA|nr:hypothetical protein RR48_02768 [Papilio machaon]
MMSPTILWLFYCFVVPNVRSDVELAGAALNSDTSLENNANSDVADNKNDLDLNRLTSDSNLAVSDADLNLGASDSANRLSRQNEQDSSVASDLNGHDNLRNLRSNLNGVGVYDFTNRANNLRHPSLSDVNGVLSGLEALHQAKVRNGRLNVVTRSGLNDQNQVSVLDGSRLSALIALNRHGVVGNGVSGVSGLNIIERNGLTNSKGLNALENVIVQRSAALREINSDKVNGVNNVNGLNGDKESLLSTVDRWAVLSKHHIGDLLNSNQDQNLNGQLAVNEVNGQSDTNGLSRSGVSGVYYRTGNVHGLDGLNHGNLGLANRLVNNKLDNLVKLRLSGANNGVNGVNGLGLLNNLHSSNLENDLNLEHQNNLLNRVHNHADDVNVLGNVNSNNANLLNELSRSGLLGSNLNNQKVSLNALKEATKLGLQQPVLLDRSILMGRSGSGLNEEDLLNAADNHNVGKLNALSALVSLSDVNNNNNLRSALNNLANQNGLSKSSESNLNDLGLVGGSNLHRHSNGLTGTSGLHANNVNSLKSSQPASLVNSVGLNSLSNNGVNVNGESGLNSLNNPETSNREHNNLSNEENNLDSEATVESRLPSAEIELDNQNRRYLGNRLRNLGFSHGKGWGPNKPVIYSPYDLPNPVVPYRPYNRPVVVPRPYRPQEWYQSYHPTTYIPYALKGRSGLNDDVPLSNDAVDLSSLLLNVNSLNDVDSISNKLVDLTDYDIDNLLSLFEKTELNGISTGKNELRSGVEVNSDNLASELDAINLSELNNKNLNNRRILSNILRRLHSNVGKNANVANNDLLNLNTNAQNGLNKLVGVDSLAIKSNNNDLEEAVNEALRSNNANEQNLEDVENVVANARRNFMRRG